MNGLGISKEVADCFSIWLSSAHLRELYVCIYQYYSAWFATALVQLYNASSRSIVHIAALRMLQHYIKYCVVI